jgi:serine protease Do
VICCSFQLQKFNRVSTLQQSNSFHWSVQCGVAQWRLCNRRNIMRSVRSLCEWPRALSARRLVLLATVASLGVAGAAVGPSAFHQAKLPAYATANAAESMQRPAGFADLVAKVKPAVISVRVKVDAGAEMMGFDGDRPLPPNSHMQRFFHYFGMPDGENAPDNQRRPSGHIMTAQGSGFFITADGYAATNNHVVDKAKAVEITTDDGKTYDAKVVGTDPRTDLALIKVDGRSDFPYVKLAETSPRIGDWVVAVGNPFGLGGTVTAYDDFIQIDAPVNKGNSGGPTFDMEGNVIGVNTAIFSPSGAGRHCQTHRLAQRRGEELLADAGRGAEGAGSARG